MERELIADKLECLMSEYFGDAKMDKDTDLITDEILLLVS